MGLLAYIGPGSIWCTGSEALLLAGFLFLGAVCAFSAPFLLRGSRLPDSAVRALLLLSGLVGSLAVVLLPLLVPLAIHEVFIRDDLLEWLAPQRIQPGLALGTVLVGLAAGSLLLGGALEIAGRFLHASEAAAYVPRLQRPRLPG
ncbi:MAG TPA: hypothetical protein VF530_11680 [Planctomycetota bacterium]